LGLVMAYDEMEPIASLIGASKALEILLEGRIFDAQEALRIGLVSRVVADDQVAAEALATAQRIASGAPLVARWHKQFARRLKDDTPLTDKELHNRSLSHNRIENHRNRRRNNHRQRRRR